MQHFINVNSCSAETVKDFHLIIAKALQVEGYSAERLESRSLKEIYELAEKPVRFTINPSIAFVEELKKQVEKKGLLCESEAPESLHHF